MLTARVRQWQRMNLVPEPSTSTPRSHLQDLALVVAEDPNHVRRVNV